MLAGALQGSPLMPTRILSLEPTAAARTTTGRRLAALPAMFTRVWAMAMVARRL